MPTSDLNALRTFVVLYELRSLTATAEQLHVTQPTVSYTLSRLRQRFGDPLFRREGHVMVPTTRATQLFGPLHAALSQIDATVGVAGPFEPEGFDGEVVLGLTSIGELTFLPPIMARLAGEASQAHLRVERVDSDQVEDGLVRGSVDLALNVSALGAPGLWKTAVRRVEYVALFSRDHPLPATGADMFAGRRFVRVSARGGHVFPVRALTEHGLLPQVSLTVDEYASVPAVLQATDLVNLLPRHVAEVFCRWFPSLRVAELPWPGQSRPVMLYTRIAASLSPVQHWFRALVLDAIVADDRSGAGSESA